MKIENAKARPAGVSLVITIIFVSAFMLILADMYQVGLNMIRNNRNAEQSGKAEYFVRSAEEVAALIAGHMEDGTPFNETQIRERQEWLYAIGRSLGETNCGNGTGQTLCAKFEVREEASLPINLLTSGTSYFSVPATVIDGPYRRGTGTAGKNCGSTSSSNANHSCHWNKLLLGESVEIPLGTRPDGRGEDYNEFKLRVRTPECSRSSESSGSCTLAADYKYRFVLYPLPIEGAESAYRDIQKDKVLVQWSITGEENGRSVTLVAARATDDEGKRDIRTGYKLNTELSAGRINKFNNTADGFSVLEADYQGKPISVEERDEKTIVDFIKSVKNPTLRLTLVTRPSKSINNDPAAPINWNDPNLNIPFLEYQLLTKCSGTCNPPKDSKYIIMGKATIGEYTKYFTKYINRRTTLGGFVLENF